MAQAAPSGSRHQQRSQPLLGITINSFLTHTPTSPTTQARSRPGIPLAGVARGGRWPIWLSGAPESRTSPEGGSQGCFGGGMGDRAGVAHHDIMSLHLRLLAHQLLTFQLQAAKEIHGFHSQTHIFCPVPPVPTFHPVTSASSAHLPPPPVVSWDRRGVTHPPLTGIAIPEGHEPRGCAAHTAPTPPWAVYHTHPVLCSRSTTAIPSMSPCTQLSQRKQTVGGLPLGIPTQDLTPQFTASCYPSV